MRLEFGAPVYVGQNGAYASSLPIRFHIRASTNNDETIKISDWMIVSQGEQVNVSLPYENFLRDGDTYTFSVRAEGSGGISQLWGPGSNPIRVRHATEGTGLSTLAIVLIVLGSIVMVLGLALGGAFYYKKSRALTGGGKIMLLASAQ